MSDYSRARWDEIKGLRVRPSMSHVSKAFHVNTLAILTEQWGEIFTGPRYLPNPGVTRNIGRNQRKREERAGLSRKAWPRVQ